MSNLDTFEKALTTHLTVLMTQPEYAIAAMHTTPSQLAARLTNGLTDGTVCKDGTAVKRTCKELGIKHTYKAIEQYLTTLDTPPNEVSL